MVIGYRLWVIEKKNTPRTFQLAEQGIRNTLKKLTLLFFTDSKGA
jgi:hypothetical protein